MRVSSAVLILSLIAGCLPKSLASEADTIVNSSNAHRSRGRSQRGLDGEEEGRYVSRRTRGKTNSRLHLGGTEPGGRTPAGDEDVKTGGRQGHHPVKVEPIPGDADTAGNSAKGRASGEPDNRNPASDIKGDKGTVSHTGETRNGRTPAGDMEDKKRRPVPVKRNSDTNGRNSAPDEGHYYIYQGSVPISTAPIVPTFTPGSGQHGILQKPNSLTCQQELCNSQPSQIKLFFTGNSCGASQNYMTGNFRFYLDSIIQTGAYIYISSHDGSNVFFSGRAAPGDTILVDNGTLLPDHLRVTIYDLQVTEILQEFDIAGNCLHDYLYIGDTYCGVMVQEITSPVQGRFGTCVPTYVQPGYRTSKAGKSGKRAKYTDDYYYDNDDHYHPDPAPVLECTAPATRLRLQLTGGSCNDSITLNNQGKDFICLLDENEQIMQSVHVKFTAPGSDLISDQALAFHDVLEIIYSPNLPNNMDVQILDLGQSNNLQVFSFNPSCSVPLAIGDTFGAFTVVGFENAEQGLVTVDIPLQPTPFMTPAPIMTPVAAPSPCKGSQCASVPKQLKFIFTGGPCSDNYNSQTTTTCTGSAPITFPAKVKISSGDGTVILEGTVQSQGTEVVIGDGVNSVPSSVSVIIMDNAGATVQNLEFNVDCTTTPLFAGYTFGAMRLFEFTDANGTAAGCK